MSETDTTQANQKEKVVFNLVEKEALLAGVSAIALGLLGNVATKDIQDHFAFLMHNLLSKGIIWFLVIYFFTKSWKVSLISTIILAITRSIVRYCHCDHEKHGDHMMQYMLT